MKKVWKYIIITLLLILGLCCVGVLYLFFIPNSQLFNITYINNNKKIVTENFDKSAVSSINLNSRSYDVNIKSTEADFVYAEVKSHSFGFVLKKYEILNVSTSLKNDILTINITEPHGFATKNNSEINLYLPNTKEFNLNLSNKNAETIIDSMDVKICDLAYSTQSGDFKFNKGSISGDITLNLNKSDFIISEEVSTNKNNVQIKNISTGKFYAEKEVLGNIEIINNSRGIINVLECINFTKDGPQSSGGRIYINKLSFIRFTSTDTDLYLGTITNGASINLTSSGSVSISNLSGLSDITTNSGNISISSADSNLILSTNSGNISVPCAKENVSVNLVSGKATINFYKTEEELATKVCKLTAKIASGSLTATGVDSLGSVSLGDGLVISNNGNAYIRMTKVESSNDIVGNNGSVYVVVEKTIAYTLSTSSQTGSVRVNLTQIPYYNGYTTKELTSTNVNGGSTNNLNISTTSGNLTVLDTNFG